MDFIGLKWWSLRSIVDTVDFLFCVCQYVFRHTRIEKRMDV